MGRRDIPIKTRNAKGFRVAFLLETDVIVTDTSADTMAGEIRYFLHLERNGESLGRITPDVSKERAEEILNQIFHKIAGETGVRFDYFKEGN